jgi:hypothetical protein
MAVMAVAAAAATQLGEAEERRICRALQLARFVLDAFEPPDVDAVICELAGARNHRVTCTRSSASADAEAGRVLAVRTVYECGFCRCAASVTPAGLMLNTRRTPRTGAGGGSGSGGGGGGDTAAAAEGELGLQALLLAELAAFRMRYPRRVGKHIPQESAEALLLEQVQQRLDILRWAGGGLCNGMFTFGSTRVDNVLTLHVHVIMFMLQVYQWQSLAAHRKSSS